MTRDLMDDRRCHAQSKRSGERCKRAAIRGGRVCSIHGGGSPKVRQAAQQRLLEAEARATLNVIWDPDAAPVTSAVESLMRLAGKLEHAVDVLGARVEVEGLDGATAIAFTRTIRELRLGLEGLERLGLEDRQVRISEQTGHMLASVVRAVLERLQLTEEQQVLAVQVVPEEFRRLSQGTGEPE